jgi:hypothetical protein
MCLVCAEWQKGNLTNKEALRNLGEFIRAPREDNGEDNAHYYKVVDDIMEKELGKLEEDADMATSWHKETYGD